MKKFKSTTGQPVRVALIDGHVAIIGTEWTDLHERFHSQAYANMCISEDMIKNAALDGLDPATVNVINNVALQKNEVEAAIRKLIEENQLDAFDSKYGKPKSNILTDMVGFRVTNAVRDEVWYKVQGQNNDAT